MRNYSVLRALSMEGHEVTILAFGDARGVTSARRDLAGLCVDLDIINEVCRSTYVEYAGRALALRAGLPYGVWRLRSPMMRSAVSDRLAEQRFDIILCDDIYQMENLPTLPRVPIVLNKHDITYEIVERFLKRERNPLKLIYGWAEYRQLRRFESRSCGEVAAVWVCSERDRQLLARDNASVPFMVVPNAVDVENYKPSDADDGHSVLFVGAMDWLPNRDAVEFFVSEIMPELRRLVPGVSFVVAGREPPEDFRRRFEYLRDVRFTGTLADLRPLIAQAAVCTVPLRIGSGTRLKILEAAAMAKPVVSTTVGAEGLSFVDGKEIIIADEPRKFAHAIADLLGDRSRRLELGREAHRHVVAKYGIPALRLAVREALTLRGDHLSRPASGDKGSGIAVTARCLWS